MQMLVTQLRADGKREKVFSDAFPDHEPLKPNQIKTRTLFSGVTNGTERNDLIGGNYAHPDEMLPCPWGYQNVGEVVEIGEDVTRVKPGDVVYSSADHVDFAVFDDQFLFCTLPESVDRREAALFGMASVAMRTCRNADIRMGERVLIVGGGLIGQIAAQIAAAMGGRATLFDINEERLEIARGIGAAELVFKSDDAGWAEHSRDFTYDVVIDVAGVPGMEDKLIGAAAMRGRVLFIAGRGPIHYTFNLGQGHEINIRQNSHFDNDDLANLCRLVERGAVRIAPLLRDVVPARECKPIYEKLRDTPHELLGTVFEW